MISDNQDLVKENNHLLHLQRLNVELKSFEPRLHELKLREEKLDGLENSVLVKDGKIRELEKGNDEIFREIRAMK